MGSRKKQRSAIARAVTGDAASWAKGETTTAGKKPRRDKIPWTNLAVTEPTAAEVRRLAVAVGYDEGRAVSLGEVVEKAVALLEADLRKRKVPIPNKAPTGAAKGPKGPRS